MKPVEPTPEQVEISRIRIPRRGEVLGTVDQMLGADRIRVNCADGNVRVCRIPGRMRKKIWIRPNDLVLVKPWVVQTNERADVAFRYNPTQANWLRRKGYIKPDLQF
jgi:translation initiation factor 1A